MNLFLALTFLISPFSPNDVLDRVNYERLTYGRPPLERNFRLQMAAQDKADALARCQCFAHTIEDKRFKEFILENGYSYQRAGENLAEGFKTTDGLVKKWMNSPGHRANILKDYQETGIGMREGYLNGEKTVFIVQLFGTPY